RRVLLDLLTLAAAVALLAAPHVAGDVRLGDRQAGRDALDDYEQPLAVRLARRQEAKVHLSVLLRRAGGDPGKRFDRLQPGVCRIGVAALVQLDEVDRLDHVPVDALDQTAAHQRAEDAARLGATAI